MPVPLAFICFKRPLFSEAFFNSCAQWFIASFGVPFGATTPRISEKVMSTPCSFRVGKFGNAGSRLSAAMAYAFSSPDSMYFRPEATFNPPNVIAPERSAVIPLASAVKRHKLELHTCLFFKKKPRELRG